MTFPLGPFVTMTQALAPPAIAAFTGIRTLSQKMEDQRHIGRSTKAIALSSGRLDRPCASTLIKGPVIPSLPVGLKMGCGRIAAQTSPLINSARCVLNHGTEKDCRSIA